MPANERDWFPHIDPLSGEVMGAAPVKNNEPPTPIEPKPKPTVRHSRLGKVIGITLLMVGLGALVGTYQPPNTIITEDVSSTNNNITTTTIPHLPGLTPTYGGLCLDSNHVQTPCGGWDTNQH